MALRWPGETLLIRNVRAGRKTGVTWLAAGHPLNWKNKDGNLVFSMPRFDPNAFLPELQFAYAFSISNIGK